MAINGVEKLFPDLTTILQSRIRDRNLLVSDSTTAVSSQNQEIPLEDTLLIKAQTFVNEILKNQTSRQQVDLLLNEVIAALSFAEQVDLLNLSQILLNEGRLTLGGARFSGVLPEVETVIAETLQRLNNQRQADLVLQTERLLADALQNLNPAQQASALIRAEVSITEALQSLSTVVPADTTSGAGLTDFDETGLPILGLENVTGTFIQSPAAIDLPGAAASEVATVLSPQAVTATVSAGTVPEVAVPETPFSLPEVNPTPYGVAVYEVDRLRQPAFEPDPDPHKIKPTPPTEKAGFIDTILARPWWPQGEGRHSYNIPLTQEIGEETIRRMIKNFNEDQVNKDRPLHLVLAKNDNGLALDLYDCSDNYVCKLVYDASLSSGELPHVLETIQQETGVFLDTKT